MNDRPDNSSHTSSNRPRLDLRTIDSILDRSERRRSNRIAEFPPDFLHGEASLDELYEAFGEEWVESAAFVQYQTAADGTPVAISIATFTDWFLTVEHLAIDDHETLGGASLQRWLRGRLGERRVVIELQTMPAEPLAFAGSRWIDVHCPVHRLIELERTFLRVHRDGCHDWVTSAQTNLLSLITLCARLGMERVN